MKRLTISLILLCFGLNALAQIRAKVDERFELVSITFALAGVPEFCSSLIPSYWEDILEFNDLYAFTEPIHFVRRLNIDHQIGYDAVSSFAAMLQINNGKISLNPKYDIDKISEYVRRWTPELAKEYIKQLNDFYKLSDFASWYKDHQPLYDLAEQKVNEYFETSAMEWFKEFYGKELDADMEIYLSLVNGPNNYSFSDGVIVGIGSDKSGEPTADVGLLSMLIHEISHHYTNNIIYSNWDRISTAAGEIYPHVSEELAAAAYRGAKTMMVEWLTNLFTFMYLRDNDMLRDREVRFAELEGFIWMERSMNFMDNFYRNRDKYPTVYDFVPQLIGFVDFTASNFDEVIREQEEQRPYLLSVYPVAGSDISEFDEITLTFSKPMNGGVSWEGWPEGVNPLPFNLNAIELSEDKTRVTIGLAETLLDGSSIDDYFQSGQKYGVNFIDFRDKDGRELRGKPIVLVYECK